MLIPFEGIFRRPRLKSNRFIKKYAPLFSGRVLNLSGADDFDKNVSIPEYFLGNYDGGTRYSDYFSNCSEYWISNHPSDQTQLDKLKPNLIYIDLEVDLPAEWVGFFDVVFCHTVFEHIFDVFSAFENMCALSKDLVIFIVPQVQRIHDYQRGYKDYWRFTPFAVDRLFENQGMTVLARSTTSGFSESQYLCYIASKSPDRWAHQFASVSSVEDYLNWRNDGATCTFLSFVQIGVENLIRRALRVFRR